MREISFVGVGLASVGPIPHQVLHVELDTIVLGINPLVLLVLFQAMAILAIWLIVALVTRAEHARNWERTLEELGRERMSAVRAARP